MCHTPAASAIHHDPLVRGVTGLDTYLWADDQAPVTTDASIRGYPVVCTATPVRWTFETGDGGRYTATAPGGPHPEQAVTHLYETRADHTLVLDVTWSLDTNYGSGSVIRSSTTPYQVIEVRSVLLP